MDTVDPHRLPPEPHLSEWGSVATWRPPNPATQMLPPHLMIMMMVELMDIFFFNIASPKMSFLFHSVAPGNFHLKRDSFFLCLEDMSTFYRSDF